MKRHTSAFFWLSLLILTTLSVACGSGASNTAQPSLPNPASVFCQEQGYRLEIRDDAQGQYGVCVFPDHSECDEWAYYRGQCGPATIDAAPPAVAQARDAALAYVRQTYGDVIPTGDLVWTAKDTSPTDLLGAGSFRFIAGTCAVDISYPIVAPDAVVYHAVIADSLSAFHWEGDINAQGVILTP